MSGRKLNPEEQKLHQAALSSTDKVLTSKEAEKIIPDVSARTAAVNFLLGAGMLKVLSNAAGVISFRAVMKKEIEVKKDMSGEEAMVLGHIQASANEGIWTKHLKAKTELHQTVIDRCLKSLVQKQLVKAIKAVRHPTRKIYMLAHLEPSVELTGGPWYTDNELDTEFIKLLSTACLHYIRDRSFPKQSNKASSQNEYRLYSIGAAPSFPSAQQIQHFLSKSKITETLLGVDHVEMLLRVLELDGEIEKLPAFTASAWDATVDSDNSESGSSSDSDSDSDSDAETTRKKRKRSTSKKKKDTKTKTKTRKRRRTEESDSDSVSESEEEERLKRKRKRSKSKKEESSDEEEDRRSKKKKKRKARDESEGSDDDDRKSSTSKRKGKGKKRGDSSDDDSESESDSDDDRHSKSRSKSKPKKVKTKTKTKKKASSSSKRVKFESPEADDGISVGGAFVYRAIRQERVALGWSQAPCGRCPVFDFCREKGPTNPQECVYYEEWLNFKGTGGEGASAVVKVEA
ncbi:RNA polymerase Rpc34 subunit-domain-containing protein [Suillus clintonianus]|uniref:RNA polymerase Rpc34 subunit-domain-containing protein n=1 Tax=Suillus clintonianus TaxID=1904413 RepID=UPI001B87F4AC|nr:RNA polymerase Rpc34 subunit-domain-containing protein [Suillus clintonianus]KAG2134084.1 RNA polymerase Rpc34 subunit-domain-containing protein [Suillus clintonianus]